MACCYIAASMIAFIINSCEALDINLQLQYNESVKHGLAPENNWDLETDGTTHSENIIDDSGISIISVSGMTCAACTHTVEAALLQVNGVQQAKVSLSLQEARVFHNVGISFENLVASIEGVGYDAVVGERAAPQKIDVLRHTKELQNLRESLQGLTLYSGLIFSLGQGLNIVGLGAYLEHQYLSAGRSLSLLGLTTVAAARHGGWIHKEAWNAGKTGRVNMHTLITASTAVGLLISALNLAHGNTQSQYFDSIVGVLLIISVGRYMELLSRRQATNTFVGLYSLMDETKSAKLTKLQKLVPASILQAGDEITVEPFSVIPCDSYVVSGTSHVNEAVITGESLPKIKHIGDLLLAGTRNGQSRLLALVHQDQRGSFLSQLVKSVETSLTSKGAAQQRVQIVTQYFVSVIFSIAVGAAAYAFYTTSSAGVYIAADNAGRKLMTILSAACPCALGLATPCAVMAGIDVAWRKGILMLEGGETMETLRDITHIIMDKTGTLTRGTPEVTHMLVMEPWKQRENDLAVLICAAEETSMDVHPLASAVFRKVLPLAGDSWKDFKANGCTRNSEESGGRGVRCEVDAGDDCWRRICLGNLEFMLENEVDGLGSIPERSKTDGSFVFVSVDGRLAVSLVLQDIPRPDAKATIDALKAQKIAVSMLTGDNGAEASRISRELGIPVTASSATPDMKLNHIKSLQKQGHKVLMVGDGMNDGPSLAAAEVGVMIAHGRKCLSSGGSVLILQSQLQSLLTLLDIAKSTTRQVSVNIAWALAYNLIAVALAIGLGSPLNIHITPPFAAAMMSVSSIFITVQGLLLRARLSARYNVS